MWGEGLGAVPELTSGRSGDPSHGDSQQWIMDALLEVRDDIAALTATVAALVAQNAEERRAAAPAPATHRAKPRRRVSDTFLTVVKTLAAIGASVAVLLAFTAPQRARVQQYSPRPVVHHVPAGPDRGR
jgi:hypothetical protein